jgi:broad specificity phosphatase PhoE
LAVIEHRRHSWRVEGGKHLTQSGVDLARRVGESMGHFDLVITSDIPRAFETAIAMGYAVDRQEKLLGKLFDAESEISWEMGFAECQRGYRLGRATARACREHASFLRSVAVDLGAGGRALVVSHGGIIEAGTIGLLPEYDYSAWGPACERCEGVRLTFDGDACTQAERLRLP